MPSITDIAEEYVERATALAPFYPGIAGHEHELADLSVDGFAERAELDRSTVADLDASETTGLREQVARAAMRERLALEEERYDAGDSTSELNVTSSWVQWVREIFDLMPTDGEQADPQHPTHTTHATPHTPPTPPHTHHSALADKAVIRH
jgi:Bacterial protein of unknown function (DUF885)